MPTPALRCLNAMRYITPLREGGSLPAVVEADDGRLYVCKFVGAGQGPKALIAEVIAGEIGRALGLRVPELVLLTLHPDLGPAEPDWEINALLRASAGLNLGLAYLTPAFAYNMLLEPPLDAELASDIVWFDAYVTNVDRTPRNVNLLLWQGELWLIDHGASLYFHHRWPGYLERSITPFPAIRDHTLLPFAADLWDADARLTARLDEELLAGIVRLVPSQWLEGEDFFSSEEQHRQAYVEWLLRRLEVSERFVQEAIDARERSL